MVALDACNRRFGRGTVVPEALGSRLDGTGRRSSRCARHATRRGSTSSSSSGLPDVSDRVRAGSRLQLARERCQAFHHFTGDKHYFQRRVRVKAGAGLLRKL